MKGNSLIIILVVCLSIYAISILVNVYFLEKMINSTIRTLKNILKADKIINKEIMLNTKIMVVLEIMIIILGIFLTVIPIIPLVYYANIINNSLYTNERVESILNMIENM